MTSVSLSVLRRFRPPPRAVPSHPDPAGEHEPAAESAAGNSGNTDENILEYISQLQIHVRVTRWRECMQRC